MVLGLAGMFEVVGAPLQNSGQEQADQNDGYGAPAEAASAAQFVEPIAHEDREKLRARFEY